MKKINKKWFSIIEVMVAIVIFTIWIAWVFTIIHSTLKLNDYNKNYIIWVNLAREQLELFRNVRDSNFKAPRNYLSYDLAWIKRFEENKTYKISNDFSNLASNTVKIKEENYSWISWDYEADKLEPFKVCIDETEKLYDYCDNISWTKKELKIYKFIEISEVPGYKLEEAVKVKSRVIWYSKKFSEFSIEEIFTNYKN